MRYLLLFLAFCFLVNGTVFSQDKSGVQFGKVSAKDFELPASRVIDTNSSAVIIADIGSVEFVGNEEGWFSHIFTRKKRIKILNKKAFELATLRIRLYVGDKGKEKLNDIDASTYNLESGKVVETKLNKKDIFEDKLDKHHINKKLSLSGVKEGSIIEYTYVIYSDFNFNLQPWQFQTNDYPCLWSEFNVEFPSLLAYMMRQQGYDAFHLHESKTSHKTYRVVDPNKESGTYGSQSQSLSVATNTNVYRWVMKDVPALNIGYHEKYISSPQNYVDMIEFQESQVSNGQDVSDVIRNWKTATDLLLGWSDFGGVINQDYSWFDDKLKQIVGDKNDKLGAAKNIYYYIQNNFTCTNYNVFTAEKSLIDIFKAKSGTVGEINMLLTALLREKQIPADPVVLSTRENGYNSTSYPILDKLDYLICKANINGDIYYLDASRPLLGFGKLTESCYNGYARVISDSHPDSVNFYSDSILEKKMTTVFVINDEKGNPSGSIQIVPGYFESYDLRQTIRSKTEKEYFKNIQTAYGSEIEITNTGVDSLNHLEYPVNVHYEFNIASAKNQDMLYFNPMLSEGYKENPFKAAERKFPVEMVYPIDEMYVFNMEIPSGYIVEEIPKSVRIAYNVNEGFFEYMIASDGNNIQLRSRVKLDRTRFSPNEYNVLRNFFGDIVKKHSEQIVFKKKK